MKISIITVFPQIYDSFLKTSLIGRAIDKGIISVNFVQLSDMVQVKERIDEPTCGPGAGMIIKPEVLEKAIESAEEKHGKGFKIFFSPQGKKLDQKFLQKFASKIEDDFAESKKIGKAESFDHLILVCSRYEGIDERVEQYYADLSLSIGDYVVMGGDLPAQVFLESFLRFIPGVVGKAESVEKESFSSSFLDYPQFGLPVEFKGLKIPEVVLSGDHAQIEKWRNEQAAKKTIENRFDWFVSSNPSKQDIGLAKKFIPNHYVALMHTQILVKDNQVGNNSITSLDIHDIARSCATYGIKNYFMVTPLEDQQKILKNFLGFWKSDEGKEYNQSRFDAVKAVEYANNFEDVLQKIKEKEGLEPLIISTSARIDLVQKDGKPQLINYFAQNEVFKQKRPILIVFGTAKGLSEQILKRSDYLLEPVVGMTDYNHLSVRSAAAIVLDRWLGLHAQH